MCCLKLWLQIAITAVTVAGATAGITDDADTCTVATPVIYLAGLASFNMIAAQAVRLWFEYSLAEEQGQVLLTLLLNTCLSLRFHLPTSNR